MLLDIQNRGQLAAGIASYNPERRELIRSHKAVGSVSDAFALGDKEKAQALMERLSGTMAIAHNRYATAGVDDVAYAQPFERKHGKRFKWFSFLF